MIKPIGNNQYEVRDDNHPFPLGTIILEPLDKTWVFWPDYRRSSLDINAIGDIKLQMEELINNGGICHEPA